MNIVISPSRNPVISSSIFDLILVSCVFLLIPFLTIHDNYPLLTHNKFPYLMSFVLLANLNRDKEREEKEIDMTAPQIKVQTY